MQPESREDNIYFARLAEQGERYEDMIKYMKHVAKVSADTHLILTLFNKSSGKSSPMTSGIFSVLPIRTQ